MSKTALAPLLLLMSIACALRDDQVDFLDVDLDAEPAPAESFLDVDVDRPHWHGSKSKSNSSRFDFDTFDLDKQCDQKVRWSRASKIGKAHFGLFGKKVVECKCVDRSGVLGSEVGDRLSCASRPSKKAAKSACSEDDGSFVYRMLRPGEYKCMSKRERALRQIKHKMDSAFASSMTFIGLGRCGEALSSALGALQAAEVKGEVQDGINLEMDFLLNNFDCDPRPKKQGELDNACKNAVRATHKRYPLESVSVLRAILALEAIRFAATSGLEAIKSIPSMQDGPYFAAVAQLSEAAEILKRQRPDSWLQQARDEALLPAEKARYSLLAIVMNLLPAVNAMVPKF